ncbi:hypothetical protein ACS0TY_009773 [Phlomoides rotata]
MVCLQETKREVVNAQFCESLWPNKDFGWVYSGSCGASGGLITIWKNSKFNLQDQWSTKGALAINGVWLEDKTTLFSSEKLERVTFIPSKASSACLKSSLVSKSISIKAISLELMWGRMRSTSGVRCSIARSRSFPSSILG